jgi:hypothetical protein
MRYALALLIEQAVSAVARTIVPAWGRAIR